MVRAKKKFMRFLLIAVSGLGLFSTAVLLTDPPPADPSNIDYANSGPSLFDLNSAAMQSQTNLTTRDPSSIPKTDVKAESVFEFNCEESGLTFETSKARFRLRGNSCLENPDEKTQGITQIQNETNGYVATVFHRPPQNFTTDFINLSQGENKIKVVFDSEAGKIEKILTVIRRP